MKEAEIDFEIEDVLSSIRRLVSQDSRPARVPRVAVVPPVSVPAEPADESFLVLTPAQRIAAAEPKPDIVAELSRLESSIAEMEAAVAEAEAAEPEAQITEPEVATEAVDLADLAALDEPEVAADTVEGEPDAEGAVVVSEVAELSEADLAPVVEVDAEPVDTALDIPQAEPAEEPALEAVVSDAALDEPEAEDDHEPDLADHAEIDARSTPQILRPDRFQQVHLVQDVGEPLLIGENAGDIDEEALRQLVAQLIREELRGVLGERITHNVRKLVRREIQRALAGHDLE